MKPTFLLLILTLALCVSARADFNGRWSGSGRAWYDFGFENDCPTLQLELDENAEKLIQKSHRTICGGFDDSQSPLELTILGGKLLWNGAPVGTITSEKIQFQISEPDHYFGYSAELIAPNEILYNQTAKQQGNFGMQFVVHGTLIKK